MIFSKKKKFKNNPNKSFIIEDLATVNHSIIKSLLPLKKDGKIDSFWTRDDKIIVKKDKNTDPERISQKGNVQFTLAMLAKDDDKTSEGDS